MPDSIKPIKQRFVTDWRRQPENIEKYQFVYHFLPHPDKRTRATLLSNKSLAIYCVIIVLIMGLFRLLPFIIPGILGYASNINIADLLKDTNETRKQNGLNELVLNQTLSEAAAAKAQDMFKNNYWAHVSPSGVEPWDFILAKKYDYVYAGENLAKNFSDSDDVVNAWMDSKSHRENLLNSHYDEVGFAVVNGVLDGYETTLVVQMFGRPRDKGLIATKEDEERLLRAITDEAASDLAEVPASEAYAPVTLPTDGIGVKIDTNREPTVLPVIDVVTASKGLTLAFGGFLATLLILDVWYSKKREILKFNGHTLAHLIILVTALISIWFVLKPGAIL